jgi:pyruvate/2-oxoglutarate/acetoin dehydrogenase E1 component/TPP-dependent pyruvate/acetoin dehydrogenase alpha subunit
MTVNLPEDLNKRIFDIYEFLTPEQIIEDYRTAYRSRQASILGRKEVLSGHAKFGIFGDGKEVPQLAMAHVFEKGDFRSGYYRDQTFMFALGELTIREYFAQIYAHADLDYDPASGGRLMNAHFITKSMNPDGTWRNLMEQYNTAADVSPTAAQMPRLVGLAYASRVYRELDELKHLTQFSNNGSEVAFGTIGNASCAEGLFWETLNAIGVLRAPAVISIWDDGYGISVSNEHQILKQDLSSLLAGFQREEDGDGYNIYRVPAWDYVALLSAYQLAAKDAREDHIPAIIHVIETTQPQGHSTSGSHERYKSEERLAWEVEYDCITRMRRWMISEGIAPEEELDQYEKEDTKLVRKWQKEAWHAYAESILVEKRAVKSILEDVASYSSHQDELNHIAQAMLKPTYPKRRDIMEAIFETLKIVRDEDIPAKYELIEWRDEQREVYQDLYSSQLVDESPKAPIYIPDVKPVYTPDAPVLNGFEILNNFFDSAFARDPRVIAFGEDVGYLGGVNQTMAGMQAKYGEFRVSDTGIREATILGQGIGMALRGLRPIVEIQYLDYILYALQTMSDDLATLRWRTVGGQIAPVIIRTRGHRYEGVWHSGSPMSAIMNLIRGVHVLVPRDMTRAAGFYNTLLQSNDPGLIIEVLNGYRKKEQLPANLSEITIPLGMPEVLREGADVTLVTYGAMCWIALEAAEHLSQVGVDVEVIDVQSLLPFDVHGRIVESLKKTARIVFADEDVPGGASAYMMQKVIEEQGGYNWLDSEPRTISSQAHRPAYGTDGNYFSKPNVQDIFETIYEMMNEADPARYPMFYSAR